LGIPAEDFPKPDEAVDGLRPLIRLLSQRALVAAHDGDWPTAITHLRRWNKEPISAARSIDSAPHRQRLRPTFTTAGYCLALPGATWMNRRWCRCAHYPLK